MRFPYFVGILGTVLALGAFTTLAPDLQHGSRPRSHPQPHANVVTSDRPALAIITVSGQTLTCEQIRAMDEVELITDESYCN